MSTARFTLLLALVVAACTSVPVSQSPRSPTPRGTLDALDAAWVDPASVEESAEPRTVEDHWILHLYTWLHARDYEVRRIDYPGSDGEPAVAHLLLPPGAGPHPAVLVFPILAGSHVVSEGLAKALVRRGYAVLRVERRPLFPDDEETADIRVPAQRLRNALTDGRRLLDWLAAHPRIDERRLATAGVSLGGIMAATLMGLDDRVQAGFFIMAGGGLAELLHDSRERPVRAFRDRVLASLPEPSREAFLEAVRPHTREVDPLTYADRLDATRVLLISGRFDRIVPPERTRVLWEAMGRPTWRRFPAGHYQLFPFFWWAAARGADLLDVAVGGAPDPSGARSTQAGVREGIRVEQETQILEETDDAVAPSGTGGDGSLVAVDR